MTLPEGVALNPAAADGLQACTQEQIGLQSRCPELSRSVEGRDGEDQDATTAESLEGAAYLATQDANPFGSLVALYVSAEDRYPASARRRPAKCSEIPRRGSSPRTSKATRCSRTTRGTRARSEAQFLPEVPFEDIELHFFGGDRAPLDDAGAVRLLHDDGHVHAVVGERTTESSSTFDITSGPNGSPCREPAAVRAVLDGRHDEHPGGWVQPVRR